MRATDAKRLITIKIDIKERLIKTMITWKFNENDFKINENTNTLIPEGDHKVRIDSVEEKVFSTGNEGFEIMLDVSGYPGKLWHRIIMDPANPEKTNHHLGKFFESFGITEYDLNDYESWVGKDGAVRVRHGAYKGALTAQVAFCLGRKQQDRLPRWQNDNDYVPDDTFDFCNSVQPTTRVERPPMSFDGFEF